MGQPRFEIPTGDIDGLNVVFYTSVPYTLGSLAVFLNGILLTPSLIDGFVESNPFAGEFVLKEAPIISRLCPDVLQVFFKDTSEDIPETVISEICGTIEAEVGLCGTLVQEQSLCTGHLEENVSIEGHIGVDTNVVVQGVLESCDELLGSISMENS